MKRKPSETFWQRKVVRPLQGFLSQGTSCKKLAIGLALGATFGTFPMLGVTTVFCTLVALILKLNMPVIQFANYLVYPLQIILLVPFYHLGDLIFSAQQDIDFGTLRNMLTTGTYRETITKLLEATLYAVIAWFLISPFLFALLYMSLKPLLNRMNIQSFRFRFIDRK